MKNFETWVADLAGFVWGLPLILLLMGTHLFYTFRLRFVQRHIFAGIRLSVTRSQDGAGEISQFGALTTALASTLGTGNIIGVATAVAAGGPGAVLWMWFTGVFGIATKYAEAVLAIRYRVVRADGTCAGGPMYVLANGLGLRWLGGVFCVCVVLAGFGMANMAQANAIVDMAQVNFGFWQPVYVKWTVGLTLTVLVALVVLGGLKSLCRVSEVLVPSMALLYVVLCLYVLALRPETIFSAIQTIIGAAFTGQAAIGGFLGAGMAAAMRFGVARGLFSNESGLGSAPIAAAAARTPNAVRQGLVAATGTFWDTVVICALTGIVVVSSGAWQQGLGGAALTRAAFGSAGPWALHALNLALFLFVFTTIIGWSYYVERAVEFIIGRRAIPVLRCFWVGGVLLGSISSSALIWNFADIANGMMALPNLAALIALHGVVAQETREHLPREIARISPPGRGRSPAPAEAGKSR